MMMIMKTVCVVCVFLTLGCVGPASGGEHSLFYTYTALSKPLNLPGIYDFIAMGLLDDRELDFYDSQTQTKVPKQKWMRETMPEDYWEKGTQSRRSKEQWFKVNVEILIDRMRHNKTDLHVLQWRHGCVVEEGSDGRLTFVRGVDEYGYDGDDFLSFDEVNSRWIALVPAAEPTKRKWDDVAILNQYTKVYLEKECVDWLTKFIDYGKEELRKQSPPEAYIFFKKSVTDPSKLTLTCMATGFYPKDVEMNIRKLRTTLPEHLVTSSGIRPSGDGIYQLRKSVEIIDKDKDLYDCYVSHSTFKEPIIAQLKNTQHTPHPSDPGLGGTSERSWPLLSGITKKLKSEHSLFYTYTALSKPLNLPGIYDFIAMGLLDDRELDYYDSQTQTKVPKQNWMREKMPADYWEKGTQSRRSKEQWFKVNMDILIDRMRHNKTDLHVLQWRHGCVVEEGSDGRLTFVRGVDEYGYDGDDFLSFDEVNSRWIALVPAAEPTKKKWDDVAILNQYTKGYLEKECVDWLTMFIEYGKEELRKQSPPEAYIFFKKSVTDPSKLTLTCMATGFYPKDVEMNIRKLRTTLPEHLVTSSGIRPSGDGIYQLRKSVEIIDKDKDLYDCYVSHNALQTPILTPTDVSRVF
ncbi:uncharacterized protein Hap1MRO34_002409 [Clarias gariepinus]|uniref:MHC class I polypeptide-related sequence A-like n=1 Tax=Clarias gariepinus TaxID=13013 RepID=UPI00234D7CC4|nr:MHC class I polypeptide-related sequence A-like [Clarias gariepinus]